MAGLLLMPGLAPAMAADEVTSFSKVRFPQDVKLPLEVSVGVVLVDFARINAREESFDIQGYLNLSWRVPSLAGKGDRRMFRDELWAPNIDFVNALEPVKVQNEAVFHVSDDGMVEERVRFRASSPRRWTSGGSRSTSSTWRSTSSRSSGPSTRSSSRSTRPGSGGTTRAFLSDWEIGDVHAMCSTTRHTSLDQTRARFKLIIDVRRRSTFYVWRVLLPLILLVVASWGVFWVDPAQLQPQISTVVAVLLSIVIFNITIDFALPKVAYFTFIDTHALMSYSFMISSIGTVFLIHHRLNVRGIEAARAVQRRARAPDPGGLSHRLPGGGHDLLHLGRIGLALAARDRLSGGSIAGFRRPDIAHQPRPRMGGRLAYYDSATGEQIGDYTTEVARLAAVKAEVGRRSEPETSTHAGA